MTFGNIQTRIVSLLVITLLTFTHVVLNLICPNTEILARKTREGHWYSYRSWKNTHREQQSITSSKMGHQKGTSISVEKRMTSIWSWKHQSQTLKHRLQGRQSNGRGGSILLCVHTLYRKFHLQINRDILFIPNLYVCNLALGLYCF